MICGFAYALVISAPVEGGLGRVSCEFCPPILLGKQIRRNMRKERVESGKKTPPSVHFWGVGKGQKGSSFDAGIG